MSVIDKSRLISWLDTEERCYAAELDKCRPTSNHYKSCQAKNEAFQAVILRINMGHFDDSQLAALKEENERMKARVAELESALEKSLPILRSARKQAWEGAYEIECAIEKALKEPANEG